jgi:hypothetical protein
MSAFAYAWCFIGFCFGLTVAFGYVLYRDEQTHQFHREG